MKATKTYGFQPESYCKLSYLIATQVMVITSVNSNLLVHSNHAYSNMMGFGGERGLSNKSLKIIEQPERRKNTEFLAPSKTT